MDLCIKFHWKTAVKPIWRWFSKCDFTAVPSFEIEPCTNHTLEVTQSKKGNIKDTARLTESGNARSEQLNTRGAYRVTNQQSLACLSGSECWRLGWFLDMNIRLVLVEFLITSFNCNHIPSSVLQWGGRGTGIVIFPPSKRQISEYTS